MIADECGSDLQLVCSAPLLRAVLGSNVVDSVEFFERFGGIVPQHVVTSIMRGIC